MITIKDVAIAVSDIIFSNEGNYASVNRDDNGALSIGKLQWHGERARDLLLRICGQSSELQGMLGALWSEVSGGASWKTRTLNTAEAEILRSVLATDVSKKVQDTLSIEDICLDIERGVGYGLSNCGALMYFADGANQYGRYSKLWKDATEKALSFGGTLDALHEAILSSATSRLERRKRTYEKIKKKEIAACFLGEETDNMKTENVNTAENTTHKVVSGDTLTKIAHKYGSDIDLIVEANREKYSSITRNFIVCGWTLTIPQVKAETASEYSEAVDALCSAGVLDLDMANKIGNEATIKALYRILRYHCGSVENG